jgi:uncharacterized membrane protein
MGLGFFVLGLVFENIYLKIILLIFAAILNVVAAIKSFKDKKNKRF